jgi:redox-sensitive bicupin YhaK (pirin superfamily)
MNRLSKVSVILSAIAGASAFAPRLPQQLLVPPRLLSSSGSSSIRRLLSATSNDDDDDVVVVVDYVDSNDNGNDNDNGNKEQRASPLRRVARVQKFARLPVWPVWMGVVTFVVSRVLGNEAAAKLEDAVGGRVCPNFFNDEDQTSPFIMLVHHRHSFWSWDVIRYIQRQFILPEGFPAHPHRGFTTLTYFMKGGFTHRDSLGISQAYGTTNNQKQTQTQTQTKHHSQWLFTGAGLLHEEMFDASSDQELYQLWINVPSFRKLQAPDVHLLGDDECPKVVLDKESETVVLAGSYQGQASQAPIMSDMSIFHVRLQPGNGDNNTSWKYSMPSSFETAVLYVRQGSLDIAGTTVPVHHTAYLETVRTTSEVVVTTTNPNEGVDFLFLAGRPLKEPVAAQGSMVMNHANEINQAYRDYELGYMGQPWDHKLTDEEWKRHVQLNPCRYSYTDSSDSSSTTSTSSTTSSTSTSTASSTSSSSKSAIERLEER